MGVGIALNCALRYPDRLLGLVLQRPPGSTTTPGERKGLRHRGSYPRTWAREGLEIFKTAHLRIGCRRVERFCSHYWRNSHIPARSRPWRNWSDPRQPSRNRAQWGRFQSRRAAGEPLRSDSPLEYGVALAQATGAAKELTPKSANLEQYTAEVRASVGGFFKAAGRALTSTRNPNTEARRNLESEIRTVDQAVDWHATSKHKTFGFLHSAAASVFDFLRASIFGFRFLSSFHSPFVIQTLCSRSTSLVR
jgi:pimeloyl-ACP methyl ester carboxylesterase